MIHTLFSIIISNCLNVVLQKKKLKIKIYISICDHLPLLTKVI